MRFLLILTTIILSSGMLSSYAQLYPDQSSSSSPSYAQQNQVHLTDKGSIKIGFYTDPANPNTTNQTKFYISFLDKNTDQIQPHIDYKVFIKKGIDQIFGIPITHTAEGTITVPFQFTDAGKYQVLVEVEGILFQPVTPEIATFTIDVEPITIPEFPLAIQILLVSLTSLIIFYRMKTKINF